MVTVWSQGPCTLLHNAVSIHSQSLQQCMQSAHIAGQHTVCASHSMLHAFTQKQLSDRHADLEAA